MNNPRHRFDLIAFDWDGTLFDSTALIVRCIQQACADLGVTVPSDQQAAFVIGLGLHDALAHAAPGLLRRIGKRGLARQAAVARWRASERWRNGGCVPGS